MDLYKMVPPEPIAVSAADITKKYLASQGLVAIRRDLAEELAKLDGGAGSHLMAYDAAGDRYVWRISVKG